LSKEDKLQRVYETAEAFRVAQQSVAPGGRIREEFIDSIMDAKDAKASQREISERCVIEPNSSKHVSRQRVAQFIEERRKKSV
jgi:hypothetical protein